ncbi:TetR/AcrR family transcriptional regulator [Rhizobium sp. SSA_523]|uniref:TetR/AcrR family transcriptional regulator n=1 Tax=Rhizobium sp. SSA_523 TaxID=2952477 RepID=UPI002090BE7D|nr:TetR/AcrR family transcriptional regulator [Rhizobium sp. SSA_523]MCO5732281.1 TetR/AcrR family transcriptional regulator [Rhizobium sp. SSA_523]WKC21316.1 TetR/AcrR family transcriptional regulator [Rhizobium sp. SSA_523]
MTTSPPGCRPETPKDQKPRLRADAQRNRDRLAAVAAEAFSENGSGASLEDIARRAGVGIGTLYRHFPTREHLVEVVYRRELELLSIAADELSHREASDKALEEWMHRFVSYMATKRGMASSLKLLVTSNSCMFTDGAALLRNALNDLLQKAVADGTVRSDMETEDVLHALSSIYSIPDTPEWRKRAHRLIDLLMDGLRRPKLG